MSESDYPDMSGGKAAFHAAPLKLFALRLLWDNCNDHSRAGNYVLWKRELDIIYKELLFVIKKDQVEKKEDCLQEVLVAFKEWYKVARIKQGTQKSTADSVLYVALTKYEELLRRVSGGAGLDMPSVDDPRYAFR